MVRFLSYGGGVQSTCIILMAVDGLIDKPDVVVFADTGSESEQTYSTVESIKKICQDSEIDFMTVKNRIEGVDEGIPLHEYYAQKTTPPYLPMVTNPRCTHHFKIYPVRRYIKTLVDQSKPKPWATCILGITTDEKHRARSSMVKWIENDYLLIDRSMSRQDCIDYIQKNWPQLDVSKSGCFCCPYQSAKKWAKLSQDKEKFSLALEMEKNAFNHGQKHGLFAGRSISIFDASHTLEDFGFEFTPEDFECSSAESGCFL
jgi:hypothetical protein